MSEMADREHEAHHDALTGLANRAYFRDTLEQVLRDDRAQAIKAVFAVHTDTASGITSDLAAIRAAMDTRRCWMRAARARWILSMALLTAGAAACGGGVLTLSSFGEDGDELVWANVG